MSYDLDPRDLLVLQMLERFWTLCGRAPSNQELAAELGHAVADIEPHLSKLARLKMIDLEPLQLKFDFVPAGEL